MLAFDCSDAQLLTLSLVGMPGCGKSTVLSMVAGLGEATLGGVVIDGTNAAMTRDVGLPLATALVSFAEGRYDDAIEILLPLRQIRAGALKKGDPLQAAPR